MGNPFSKSKDGCCECVGVERLKKRIEVASMEPLSNDDLEDLTDDFVWIRYHGCIHPECAKMILVWEDIGIMYSKGFKVF